MKFPILGALCAIAVITTQTRVAADDEQASPAVRLLEIMEFEKTAIESAAGMFEPMMEHFGQMGLPPEAMQEIKGATDRFMQSIFSDPAIATGIAAIYERSFTRAELEDLIVFYDTPLGRKMIATQPVIAQATAEVTMKATAENQAAFQEEIMKIMEKHQGAGDAGDGADDVEAETE